MNALGQPRSVLLLGGTSDIGLAVVRALGGPSLRRVVLAGRDTDRLGDAARCLYDDARTVSTVDFDATAYDSHGRVVDEVFEAHGDIDVAIIAFGILGDQQRIEAEPDRAIQVGLVNYLGVVSVGLRLAERMRAQGHGWIVLLSSVAGERARRANFVYGSSKAGADAFAQGLAQALDGTGVRVMIVRPGFVRSTMTSQRTEPPLAATPTQVARAVARALERGDDIVYVPRQLRFVTAVLRHLPRRLMRFVRT